MLDVLATIIPVMIGALIGSWVCNMAEKIKWKFWKKCVVEVGPVKKKVKIATMRIHMSETRYNIELSTMKPVTYNDPRSDYMDFYLWYFNKSSELYYFDYKRGGYIIKRSEIKRVEFYFEERWD